MIREIRQFRFENSRPTGRGKFGPDRKRSPAIPRTVRRFSANCVCVEDDGMIYRGSLEIPLCGNGMRRACGMANGPRNIGEHGAGHRPGRRVPAAFGVDP